MRTFNEVKTQQREKPFKPPEQGLLRGEGLCTKPRELCSRAWLGPGCGLGGLVLAELPRGSSQRAATCMLKMCVLPQRAVRFTFPLRSAWECHLTTKPISGAFWGVSTVTICSPACTPPSRSLPCELTSLRDTGTEITLLCSSLTIFILLWTSVMAFIHRYGWQREC